MPVIGIIARLKYMGFNKDNLKNIYYSLIHSQLTYLDIMWSSCIQSKFKELEVLQNRAVRILFNLAPLTPTKTIYELANIIPLKVSVKYSFAKYCYKIQHKTIYSRLHFKANTENHLYNTRNKDNITQEHYKSCRYGTRSTTATLVNTFNNLPREIKTVSSFSLLKKNVKKHFLSEYYSVS